MVIEEIRNLIESPRYVGTTRLFKRSLAKEKLIPHLLRFVYRHKQYRKLVFYGGTCAHLLYGLERLSEDIDLHNPGVEVGRMKEELVEYVRREMGEFEGSGVYEQEGEGGVRRLVVKLPIMYKLGLSSHKREKLHLKLEISGHNQVYKEEVSPVVVGGLSMVVRHFDEASLMAGKVVACLRRVRMRGEKVSVKGRDWYDLWWWLKRGVEPNWEKLNQEARVKDWSELGDKLKQRLAELDLREVELDLLPFWEDPEYVREWVRRMREEIREMLGIM